VNVFDEIAAEYDGRPGYPERVYQLLVEKCGLGPRTRVLELGPGTGQATLRLVELGANVVAVEAGATLAERLRARTKGLPVRVVVGDFRTVDVPRRPFELAVAATSLHILADALAKVASLLTPDGWLAAWWTHFGRPDRSTPVSVAIDEICERHQGPRVPTSERALEVDNIVGWLTTGGYFEVVHVEVVEWEMTHTAGELRRLFATLSATLALEPAARTAFLDEVEAMVNGRFGGAVSRQYLTPVYLAKRG
jgi:SAM-dependent methyltransferase